MEYQFKATFTVRSNVILIEIEGHELYSYFHNFGYAELPSVRHGNSTNVTRQRKLITDDKIKKVKGNLDSSETRAKRSPNEQDVNTEEEVVVTQSEVPEESSSSDCTRHEMYVDFEKIGWSGWIVSPKGYNAYYCKGECSFPLGQNQYPTNHATVQSIVHVLFPRVGDPCCVPNKLLPIRLLYFDDHQNVVLKQYENMVAESCGCQ
ncbi:bone morphogenetic protein 5-like [Limulus polyphemus]|uniref:Bone morphogenetic protein 5-like n=1 Tax=Limulus polyphemus TaxID=6850 RepID=A0ABM1SEZ8_LIMPO|nr:bone morphogenetic protein 5-like [Limulus polyphemus]